MSQLFPAELMIIGKEIVMDDLAVVSKLLCVVSVNGTFVLWYVCW